MLYTMLMTLQGTPYIYQGEEIGMTNSVFEKIEDFDDVEDVYKRQTFLKLFLIEDFFRKIGKNLINKDNTVGAI